MRHHRFNHHRFGKRGAGAPIFLSGLLILIGGFALLSEFNMTGGYRLAQVWPIALIWHGMVDLLLRGIKERRPKGLGWIFIGALALVHTLGIVVVRWQIIWPALLIFAGISILFKKGSKRYCDGVDVAPSAGTEASGDASTEADACGSQVDVNFFMTGVNDQFDGRQFSGGRIRCVMSGYELDLRGAEMVGDKADLHIDATFAGIELKVPRHWYVESTVDVVMGAVENKTRWLESEAKKTLLLKGNVVLGGIEIRN